MVGAVREFYFTALPHNVLELYNGPVTHIAGAGQGSTLRRARMPGYVDFVP